MRVFIISPLFKGIITVVFSLAIFTQQAIAQNKVFEVFGTNSADIFGEAISCDGKIVFVAAPGAPKFSSFNVGEVRAFDADTQLSLYTLPNPNNPVGGEIFGSSLLVIPDSDNDGRKELIVGAPGDITFFGNGNVFAFNIGAPSSPIFSSFGLITGDRFGASLATLDFPPKDGAIDIIIGAPNRPPASGSGIGAIEIRGPKVFSVSKLTIEAPNTHLGFGHAISRLGDLDSNSSDDIIVGAPGTNANDGSVLIYSLLADPNPPVLLRTLKGLLGSEERLGFSAQGLPDLNQDGKAEVLIGAPGTETTAGKVYLYSGADIVSSSSSITPLCTITDPAVATFFGHALTFLDDDNKDGKIEFVASAPGASLNRGEIRFYQFTTGIGCEEVAKVTGSSANDFLGRPLGADFCSSSSQRVLTAGTTTTNGSGNIVGSAILFSPLPTVTPTATPTATQTATATPTLTPPPQINPSKASLSFRISETGEFKITSIYDQEPGNNCSFILYSRIQVGNRLLEAEKISSGVTSDQAQEKNKIIKILNFPSAEKISGQIPIVHMLLRTTCDSKTFDSNIFARYMNCGLPDISVSLSSWITTLKNALSTAEVQTSIRSDRMLKLIRLKKRRFRK